MDDDIIMLDSDSDFEDQPSPPKRNCRSSRRHLRGRKQNSSAAVRNTRSRTRRSNPPVVVQDEESGDCVELITLDESLIASSGLPVEQNQEKADGTLGPISAETTNKEHETTPAATETTNKEHEESTPASTETANKEREETTTPTVAESEVRENKKPAAPQKTTRRGLARKLPSVSSTESSVETSSSHYTTDSNCVQKHRSFYLWSSTKSKPETKVLEDDSEETNTHKDETTPTTPPASSSCSMKMVGEPDEVNVKDDVEIDTAPLCMIRSPTPPPSDLSSTTAARKPRMTKKLSQALQILNRAKENKELTTPSKRSSRKKGGRTTQLDDSLILLGAESPQKTDITIKIRYLSTVHRIGMKQTDQLLTLLSKLSQELGEEEYNLTLYLRDESLSLKETPKSIGLTVADILECHSIKVMENSNDEDGLKLLVQFPNQKKRVEIAANKKLPLKSLLQRLASDHKLPPDSFYLSFDGEHLTPGDTPLKLDMDDGDILDLVML